MKKFNLSAIFVMAFFVLLSSNLTGQSQFVPKDKAVNVVNQELLNLTNNWNQALVNVVDPTLRYNLGQGLITVLKNSQTSDITVTFNGYFSSVPGANQPGRMENINREKDFYRELLKNN